MNKSTKKTLNNILKTVFILLLTFIWDMALTTSFGLHFFPHLTIYAISMRALENKEELERVNR